jgi:hypothetical protein
VDFQAHPLLLTCLLNKTLGYFWSSLMRGGAEDAEVCPQNPRS